MKNFLTKMLDVKSYLPKLALGFLIFSSVFAFTAGAAMGLDGAVTHHGFGLAVFILGIVLTFVWMVDASLRGLIKTYRDLRGEELISFIVNIIYASLAGILLLMTIVALAIH